MGSASGADTSRTWRERLKICLAGRERVIVNVRERCDARKQPGAGGQARRIEQRAAFPLILTVIEEKPSTRVKPHRWLSPLHWLVCQKGGFSRSNIQEEQERGLADCSIGQTNSRQSFMGERLRIEEKEENSSISRNKKLEESRVTRNYSVGGVVRSSREGGDEVT